MLVASRTSGGTAMITMVVAAASNAMNIALTNTMRGRRVRLPNRSIKGVQR